MISQHDMIEASNTNDRLYPPTWYNAHAHIHAWNDMHNDKMDGWPLPEVLVPTRWSDVSYVPN